MGSGIVTYGACSSPKGKGQESETAPVSIEHSLLFACGSNQHSNAMLHLKKGGTTQNFNTAGKTSFTSGINSAANNTSLLQDLSGPDQKSMHPVKGHHGQTNVRSSEVNTRFQVKHIRISDLYASSSANYPYL